MEDLIRIYVPAAVIAIFLSAFLGRLVGYKRLLYAGVYCLVVPIFGALKFGELGQWSVALCNSAGLVLISLALWLSARKRERERTEVSTIDQAVAE